MKKKKKKQFLLYFYRSALFESQTIHMQMLSFWLTAHHGVTIYNHLSLSSSETEVSAAIKKS